MHDVTGAEGLASAAGGKRRAAWSQETPTPETGCEHDRVFCKNVRRTDGIYDADRHYTVAAALTW